MTLDERDPILMADNGPFLEDWAPGTPSALVVYEDEDVPFSLQTTRVPLILMTTRRFARQLVEWGINLDAVAPIEEVAKTFAMKTSMFGEIDTEVSVDFRQLPRPDDAS